MAVKTSELVEYPSIEDLERLIASAAETVDHELHEKYPLSQTQTSILVEVLRHPGTTMYNLPMLYALDDAVDVRRLERAVRRAIEAHPYLFM